MGEGESFDEQTTGAASFPNITEITAPSNFALDRRIGGLKTGQRRIESRVEALELYVADLQDRQRDDHINMLIIAAVLGLLMASIWELRHGRG